HVELSGELPGGPFVEPAIAAGGVGFVAGGLGAVALLGGNLVNVRGLLASVAIGVTVFDFYDFLFDPFSLVSILIIAFVGILRIIIDGKVLNGGTLATLGLAGMILSVALAAPNFYAGLYSVIGVIVGGALSFAFLKVFKKRNMWSKIMLKDRLTEEAGYSSLNEEFAQLIGKEGIAMTDMRPVGTIMIGDKDYSGISNAQWIKKGTKVKVTQVDGTRILVKEVEGAGKDMK